MEKMSFRKYLNPSDLKKVIDYHLNGRTKIKQSQMNFTASTVIFRVSVGHKQFIYALNHSRFMDAEINNGRLIVTFGMSADKELKQILDEIKYFNHFPNQSNRMGYPEITLKRKWDGA
jgi:hypothetical protein